MDILKITCIFVVYLKIKNMKKITTDEFIKRAKVKHGDKYDYSKVEYVTATTPVKIICPEHGEFWQTPSKHVSAGHGCPKCGRAKQDLIEKFICEAKAVHGDKYDYSESKWNGFKEKIKIICPEHGPFLMDRQHHILRKQGCPVCANLKKGTFLTTEEFIEKAKKLYGDLYTYEKTIYKDWYSKVLITCSIHGDFEVTAGQFLTKHSVCPGCKSDKYRNTIIKKSEIVFWDNMKKSNKNVELLEEWKGMCTKTKFKCLTCNHEWITTPQTLMKAVIGCPVCGKNFQSQQCRKTHEQFVKELSLINSKIQILGKYETNIVPIKCKCLICGKEFEMTPAHLLQGYGCKICNKSLGERTIINILEEFEIPYEHQKYININDKRFFIDFCVNETWIEYNGIQHYESLEYFGGETRYLQQVDRDQQLRYYCQTNNIHLIEIPYTANTQDKILEYLKPILINGNNSDHQRHER